MTNKKGQAAIVGTILVVIVSLMVGLFVYAEVDNSVAEEDMVDAELDLGNCPTANYTTANCTIAGGTGCPNCSYTSAVKSGVVSNSNSAFDITSILPLVIGAAAILGVIAGGAFLSGKSF